MNSTEEKLPNHEQFTVMGQPIDLKDNYVDWLLQTYKNNIGCHVVTLNAEMVMQAEANPALAEVIKKAELVIPDGAGIVLYGKLHGKNIARCPGIELASNLLEAINTTINEKSNNLSTQAKVFFYGGSPQVIANAVTYWQNKLPNIAIAHQHGYISEAEQMTLLKTLTDWQPQLILVGLGVPKQELWIAENRHCCPQAIWIGIGGSFDIWGGAKERAPAWMQANHLEWLYRLYKEPWRWKRMSALPQFAWKAITEKR